MSHRRLMVGDAALTHPTPFQGALSYRYLGRERVNRVGWVSVAPPTKRHRRLVVGDAALTHPTPVYAPRVATRFLVVIRRFLRPLVALEALVQQSKRFL